MNHWMLQLYHRLPPQVRAAAAGARGWYLRAWRYGPDTDRLADAALARERWSSAQWASG